MAANAKNGRIKYEGGQSTVSSYQVMTDSGDHIIYNEPNGLIWSGRSGFEPTVRPDGIVSIDGGGFPLSTNATNDTITITGGTCYIGGALVTWTDTTDTITRGGVGTEWRKNSVIVNSSGTVSVIQADGHASAFSDTRGADGGPATLTVDTVELGQIWTDSDTAAVILASEIKQNSSANQAERWDDVNLSLNNVGIGQKANFAGANSAQKNAFVEFSDTLEVSHGAAPNGAATATKKVWIEYATPTFSNAAFAKDWSGALNTESLTSNQYYDSTRGAASTSLESGSFVYSPAGDPVTDPLLKLSGEKLTFQCFPDKNKLPYWIMQGTFSYTLTVVAEGVWEATITVVPEVEQAGFSGT